MMIMAMIITMMGEKVIKIKTTIHFGVLLFMPHNFIFSLRMSV